MIFRDLHTRKIIYVFSYAKDDAFMDDTLPFIPVLNVALKIVVDEKQKDEIEKKFSFHYITNRADFSCSHFLSQRTICVNGFVSTRDG